MNSRQSPAMDKNRTEYSVNVSHASNSSDSKETSTQATSYDAEGAMKYIVATIIFYAVFGVFCTLLSGIRSQTKKHDVLHTQDENISKYLKKEKKLKMEGDRLMLHVECLKMTERVRALDQKMTLARLEKELGEKVKVISTPPCHKKRQQSTSSAKRGVNETVSKMGFSFLFLGDRRSSASDKSIDRSTEAIELEDMSSGRRKEETQYNAKLQTDFASKMASSSTVPLQDNMNKTLDKSDQDQDDIPDSSCLLSSSVGFKVDLDEVTFIDEVDHSF